MSKLVLLFLAGAFFSASAFSNVVGVSAHPFQMQARAIQTEFTSNLSSGSGFGVQARYFQRLSRDFNLDAGFGLAGGERSSRIFLGGDYMLLPDYDAQPRVSIKTIYERTRDFGVNRDNLGIAPTLSKGFSFWGNEAFPFVALPVKLSLDDATNSYQTVSSLAFGITGRLPIEGYKNLIGNIEANLDINNSYTGLLMGIAYPL